VPFIFAIETIVFLDSANISYATLTMSTDLHFSAAVFGLGAGIFFIGYVLFQIPISIFAEIKSTRKLVALLLLTSGLISIATSFINSDWQFYLVRFALGASMAGIFPALVIYSSHWFRARERATVFSILISATAFSQIIAGPISTQMLMINWLGSEGWRWLFILQAMPAIVMAPITYFVMTNRPRNAKWLSQDDIGRLEIEIEAEKRASSASYGYSWKKAIREKEVMTLTAVYALWLAAAYGLLFFIPTLISEMKIFALPDIGLIVAAISIAGFASLILTGISSDRKKERKAHAFVPLVIGALALLGCFLAYGNNITMTIILLAVAVSGIGAGFGVFWTLPTLFLSEKSAAVSIGFIGTVGSIGGFFGPAVTGYLKATSGSFVTSSFFIVVLALVAAGLILTLKSIKKTVLLE